jgi:hypothetical protein
VTWENQVFQVFIDRLYRVRACVRVKACNDKHLNHLIGKQTSRAADRRLDTMNPHVISDMFATIAQAPNLCGARCKGRPETFELPATNDTDYTRAVRVAVLECECCPCLIRCQQYLDGMHPLLRPDSCVMAGCVLARVDAGSRRLTV